VNSQNILKSIFFNFILIITLFFRFCQKTNTPDTETEYTKRHIEEAKALNPKVLKDIEEKVVVTENVKAAMDHIKKLHFLEIFALCMTSYQ
jgi:hypothetical protein